MVRLYVNVGRKEGVSAPDLVALFCEGAGLQRSDLGRVQVRDTHSYVGVRADAGERVVQRLHGRPYKGRDLIVEPARR